MIHLPRWMRLILFYVTSAMAVMMGLIIVLAVYSIGTQQIDKEQPALPLFFWVSAL